MKTAIEYQQYFESEFEKKIQELLEEKKSDKEYSFEDARCDATAYFCNDCEDYDAVAGMYIGYASGDASKALEDFTLEIDGESTEYDKAVISRLEKVAN